MSSILLTKLQQVPIYAESTPPIYQKDAQGIGTILGTSLYASSTPGSKAFSDDHAIVGATKDGYPFLLCVDGFHGCEAKKVFTFVEQAVMGTVETYQLQLQNGLNPEEIVHAWQNALFTAKQPYANQGVDFTLGAVVTFHHNHKTYAVGWSIGDIGMLYKPMNGDITNLLPQKKVNGFKDAFDDATCQNPSAKEAAISRSGWFCQQIEPGDEIVAYTYLPEDLLLQDRVKSDGETQIILAKLDTAKCNPTIHSAIDQLWNAIYKAHQIALQTLKNTKSYRMGDDCTLCQIHFPHADVREALKEKYQEHFLSSSSSSQSGKPIKTWAALLKPPKNIHVPYSTPHLKEKQKAGITQLDRDLEAAHSREVMQTIQGDDVNEQVLSLERLGDHYLKCENWKMAAKMLNSALAIFQKHRYDQIAEYDPAINERLLVKLKQVETLFLQSKGITILDGDAQSISKYRAHLMQIRSDTQDRFDQDLPIKDNIQSLTDAYKAFLASLIEDAQAKLGTPPVQWACFATGSMARGEMCLFSDLEFAFTIEKRTEDALLYFRTLAELLELMIINLGETRIPLYRDGGSPTIGGFSLDSGGNTPLGKPGLYELINTPNNLARFQSEKWMEDDIIVMNALATVCHVAGDRKLVEAYNKAKEAELDKKDGSFFTGTSLREKFILKLLRGHFSEFRPDLSARKENEKAFGIKKELYRPFQEILNCLALFYRLNSQSTLGRVQELCKKGVFGAVAAENLEFAISKVLSLRMKAHLFYGEEKEFLCHIDEETPREKELLYLEGPQLDWVRDIYRVLIPFCDCCKQFYQTKSRQSFKNETFFDPHIDQAKNWHIVSNFTAAESAYHQALALDPNNVEALIKLSRISTEFGDSAKGLVLAEKALKIASEIYEQPSRSVALSHRAMAYAYTGSKNHLKAFEHHQSALTLHLEIFGEQHKKVAKCYYNIAELMADPERAIEMYEKALAIYSNMADPEKRHMMLCYSGIGSAKERQNKMQEAADYHQKAINIAQTFRFELKKTHLVAKCYGDAGDFLYRVGQYHDAYPMFQEALRIDLQALNTQGVHPRIAERYNSVGSACRKLGNFENSLRNHQTALKIFTKIYGEKDVRVALTYRYIGMTLAGLGRNEEALEYELKNLKIILDTFGEVHSDLIVTYSNLGHYYERLEKYPEALEFFQKTLKISLKVNGEEDQAARDGISRVEKLIVQI